MADRIVSSIHSWVLRTRHHTILIDTCVGNHWSSAFCSDPEEARRTRRRVLEQAAAKGSLLYPQHFAGPSSVAWRSGRGGFAYLPRKV